MNFEVRPARLEDCSQIFTMIQELAEFEKLSHAVLGSSAELEMHLFGVKPVAEALIAESSESSQGRRALGFALFFHSFSTFLTKPGIYLEDLYVRADSRSLGVGIALLRQLAQIALQRNCGRMEWSVLNWNERAIEFYLKLGAKPQSEWTVHRLGQAEIQSLASGGTD